MSTVSNLNSNAISRATAQEWTTNWRGWMLHKDVPQKDVLKGFFIPIVDIMELANDPVIKSGVRAYMALTNKEDPSSVKVVLVAVDVFGKDIIEPLHEANGTKRDGDDDPDTIYDVTSPCPALCDPESPLF